MLAQIAIDWSFLANYGVLGAVLGAILFCLRYVFVKWVEPYVPHIIQGLIDLINELKTSQQVITQNTIQLKENSEKLTETVTAQAKDLGHCKTTSSALLGFVDVFDAAVDGHPNADRVRPKLAAIKFVLTDIPPK